MREYYRRRCDHRRYAAYSQARLSVFLESPVNFRAVRQGAARVLRRTPKVGRDGLKTVRACVKRLLLKLAV
jgi:hypothetical protein